jgi:CRP/FNR family transcriptional regulator
MGPIPANLRPPRPKRREGRQGFLADFELFRGLADREFRNVSFRIDERRYPQGTAIFRRDDPCDFLYALKEGVVKLVARTDRGKGTVLHILRPADIFGELLLFEEKRPFDAVAVTDVLVAVIPRKHLVKLLASIPALRLNFIRILSRRLARMELGISDFRHTWSYQRLAKVLLRICEDYGEEVAGRVWVRLPLLHADLANMIGTARETVTNQMNRFRRIGIVASKGRHLVIDRHRLREFLGSGESGPYGEPVRLRRRA